MLFLLSTFFFILFYNNFFFIFFFCFFFFQAEDGIRDTSVTGVQTCALPISAEPLAKQEKYSRCAHSAVFAEVKVDQDFGTVSVPRIVSAIAAGRILNPKTARSQIRSEERRVGKECRSVGREDRKKEQETWRR